MGKAVYERSSWASPWLCLLIISFPSFLSIRVFLAIIALSSGFPDLGTIPRAVRELYYLYYSPLRIYSLVPCTYWVPSHCCPLHKSTEEITWMGQLPTLFFLLLLLFFWCALNTKALQLMSSLQCMGRHYCSIILNSSNVKNAASKASFVLPLMISWSNWKENI